MKNILPLSDDEFSLFQKLLIEESGLYFDKDRSRSLTFALGECLQKRGYDSYREYYNLLKFHPEGRIEIRELLDLVTIGETYFFRNRPQFEALVRFVFPEIIQKKMYSADRAIRVWSAGCSKGDEPYSIAIAIMETLPSYENWAISILGTDVNRGALTCAKEGIYRKKDIGYLPGEYFDKYFLEKDAHYILDESVKKMVHFERHNLAKDPFSLEGMQNLDIVFCRNVTIYFDSQTTLRAIDNFHNCLNQNGYLFLGHAETLWRMTDKFQAIEFPRTFIYKKVLIPVEEEAMKPFMEVPEIRLEDFTPAKGEAGREVEIEAEVVFKPIKDVGELPRVQEELEPVYREAARLFKEKNYDKSLSLFDEIIVQDKDSTRAYFARATILANQAKYEEAVKTLAKIIEVDNLYVEAYYLLGVLSYKTGDFKEAEAQFRRVIYIDSEVILAYFNLGNIYLYQRKYNQAAREFNNAVKLLEKRAKDGQVRFCEDFTVEFLLRACKNNLTEIDKKGQLYG